jgi:ATP-dependent Lhr-like helicase
LDVLAQHILAIAVASPFQQEELLDEIRSAAPYAGLRDETFEEILNFIATGGYALKAYDRFRRLVPEPGGTWRIARPQIAQQHRLNAGVIVEQPLLTVRFRNGRKLGTIEEGYASTLAPGDHFYFSGLSLEVEQFKDTDIIVRASSKTARIVTYGGQRMSMSTHLANRVRQMLCDRNDWHRFPDDVRDWLEVQSERSVLPEPHQLLVETFPHEGQHFMVAYSFEGWNAHQSLGMLLTKRMEKAGLKPLGFVANDYGLACYGLEPITDPKSLFSPDILEREFVEWVENSHLLKSAFREVAVIGGLVERQHPGKKKTGRQVSFSTDLIYDVLRRYEPQHLLLRAAWDDARRRMTELGRLVRLVDRASSTMLHVETGRITPMAVPLMVIVGREALPPGAEADETLLTQAEALAQEAMTL